jgi:hypothetical protein
MATSPVYYTTPKIGYCRLTSGVAATDGSGAPTGLTWYGGTAPTADYMLVKVVASATNNAGTADLADSLLHIWVDDGSTPRLFRTVDLGNQAVGTTALSAGQWEINFAPGEFCFPSNVLPEFTVSVTPTAGNLDIVAWLQMA